ncbi:TrbG/VirB9 family P-type conjugative transfer protein [Ferrovibrio sp.]|uniref:TrbG/VirB9 family P-type conjugative transfer protein n=1 Tax=Ferrovibrio sp. TaxID=1917215 RepID=UPI0025BF092F|nr:TrbG/VirB9 family P-type conjugative transfer protein [Ferrovibrio sp.]
MIYLVLIAALVCLAASMFGLLVGDKYLMRWCLLVGFIPFSLMAYQLHRSEKRAAEGSRPGPLFALDFAVFWVVVAVGVLVAAASATAQTAVGGPRVLGGSSSGIPTPAPLGPVTAVPVPDSMVRQAADQAEGKFTAMKRGAVGGQVQEAWDSDKAKGTFKAQMCNDCEYKVRLREYMVSLIELPTGEQIENWDNGDTENFEVVKRGDRRIAVRPQGFGIDTNLIVYGKSGQTYPIYLRTESINSRNVPDLRFVIEGHVRIVKPAPLASETEPSKDNVDQDATEPAGNGITKPRNQSSSKSPTPAALAEAAKAVSSSQKQPDFVQTAAFSPDRLRGWGNYSLRGSNELKPETVFRDDYFTYIRFGDKWKDIELPTAYIVVDGIDETVNTRVNGTTLVVESTQRLITLKSGLSFICIEYRGV